MRLRFFAAHQVVTLKPAEEEQIANKLEVSSTSSFSESDEDSTSLSDERSSEQVMYEDDDTPLPEFDAKHANHLRNLLLSPLEPDCYF